MAYRKTRARIAYWQIEKKEEPGTKMDDQLKTLFEYTKWHIGLYSVLIVALIGIFEFYGEETSAVRPYLTGSLFALIVAGMAGGIVGSSIPYHHRFRAFMEDQHWPWRPRFSSRTATELCWPLRCLTGKLWTHLEHLAFWVAIVVAVIGVLCAGNDGSVSGDSPPILPSPEDLKS